MQSTWAQILKLWQKLLLLYQVAKNYNAKIRHTNYTVIKYFIEPWFPAEADYTLKTVKQRS